jgi:tRNA dimethylallyltransferase
MATESIDIPLVVIVGPTASGKTSLAVDLAKRYDGEVICADSRTIYKGMDIGTAKPTLIEQDGVPHWGLDLVEPGEQFSVADFKKYADAKIADIRRRGRLPFLVGGSGLYVDAVVFNYQFGLPADKNLRARLDKMSLEELYEYCRKNNVILPENDKNKRYVIRAIERNSVVTTRNSKPQSTSIIVGIATDRDELRSRIRQRAEQIFDDGVVEEATMLGKKYGWNNQAMTGNVYPLVHDYLDKKLTLDEMKEKSAVADWRLAKRQLTWLRRNPFIRWLNLEEAHSYLEAILAKK